MTANDQRSEIGLVGLAVMGQNLALNIADHGFRISVYNRTTEKMEAFVDSHPDTPGGLVGCATLEDLVTSLKRPRKIIVMVKAGSGTDAVIDQLAPRLDEGDILIDGGNSKWTDTIAREQRLAERGLRFIGTGISGGEEGARFGPSLMPGGQADAWKELEPVWTAIAAKVDPDTGKPLLGAEPGKPIEGGEPCTAYIGPDGAGHYVKMVHNGIEYADMQMICEAYDLMQRLAGMTPAEICQTFARWNDGVLDSYLVEITADVLQQTDPVTGEPFVDVVLDAAGQKGTGKWTSINALDMGVPAPTIAEAVFARCISAFKDERVEAAKVLSGPTCDSANEQPAEEDRESLLDAIHNALYCAKICSYAQGFELMRAAQAEYGWTLDLGAIAQIWRGGCIIRADFLQKITDAYRHEPELANLLLAPHFTDAIDRAQIDWRKIVVLAAQQGVPVPTFASSLAYYDSYRSARLPQNLLQAQRDYFGAHTYERIDQPRGRFFHLDWFDRDRPQIDA